MKCKKKYLIWKVLTAFSILCFFSLSSCDAPRINPYDPYNNESVFVYIDGNVISYNSEPITDVKITWGTKTSYSDQKGKFSFEKITKENGWLFFEKDGFFNDSLFINWNEGLNKTISIKLNTRPITNQLQYYSVIQNRSNLPSTDYIYIRSKIIDPDDQIDSVYLEFNGNKIKDMNFNISTKYFETPIYADELHLTFIDNVVGKEINLIVVDSRKLKTKVADIDIERVIRKEIEPESPMNNDSVDLPIIFKWKPYYPGFNFSYLLQIFTNEIEPQLVSQKAFPSNYDKYSFESYLSTGNYFWVLWCIDEYNNRTRSKPASFILR